MATDVLKPTITISEAEKSATSEQFLRFHLAPNTNALLAIQQLTEVLRIPIGQIMPIHHMPTWVMGVYNWRGEILWMVDLGYLLGLTPWYQQALSAPTYSVIVLHTKFKTTPNEPLEHQSLGLVVSQVKDIEWVDLNRIQSPPGAVITAELAPFLKGYWMNPNGEMLDVLDGNAIFHRMPRA